MLVCGGHRKKNKHFDKNGLVEDMVEELIIKHDGGDEMEGEDNLLGNVNRQSIDVVLRLSQQQSEDKYNYV